MTRTGKIARLPHTIREQLNRRLQDGELGKPILQWLNSLPEVKALFDAREQRRASERQRELAERLQKAQSAGRILERLFSELKASEKTRRPKKNKPSREPADPASPPAPSSSDDQSDPPSSAPEPGP